MTFRSRCQTRVFLDNNGPRETCTRVINSNNVVRLCIFGNINHSTGSRYFARCLPNFTSKRIFFTRIRPIRFRLFNRLCIIIRGRSNFFDFAREFRLRYRYLRLFQQYLFRTRLSPFATPFRDRTHQFRVKMVLYLVNSGL